MCTAYAAMPPTHWLDNTIEPGGITYYSERDLVVMVRRPPVETQARECPNCGAPFEPVCSYCKTVR